MQIKIAKEKLPQPLMAIRRLGYGLLQNRRSGQQSYVRRLHGDLYPRFHLYVEDEGTQWSLNLHLDQRAPVYAGQTAHGGEYDGEVVEREAIRIRESLQLKNQP